MNIKKILGGAAGVALVMSSLASCGGNAEKKEEVRPLSEYKNVSAADSLIYYFGQLRAVDYWQQAVGDTMLRSRESRDEYMRGLRAGIEAAKENDAYNQGLYVGIQLAMNMKEFSEEFDCGQFNRKILVNAIADGLQNDSVVDAPEASKMFREVLASFEAKKEAKDMEASHEALAGEAKSQKWTRVSDDLYAGKGEGGSGVLLKSGDTADIEVVISTLDGKEIDRRESETGKIGEIFPGPITQALLAMSLGETKNFYTTPPALLGRYYPRYNLKPAEIIVIKIKTSKAGEPAPEVKEL